MENHIHGEAIGVQDTVPMCTINLSICIGKTRKKHITPSKWYFLKWKTTICESFAVQLYAIYKVKLPCVRYRLQWESFALFSNSQQISFLLARFEIPQETKANKCDIGCEPYMETIVNPWRDFLKAYKHFWWLHRKLPPHLWCVRCNKMHTCLGNFRCVLGSIFGLHRFYVPNLEEACRAFIESTLARVLFPLGNKKKRTLHYNN